jgi:S-adenosylmethionine decarboxylase
MLTLCQHTLLEYHGCDRSLVKHADQVRSIFLEAVRLGRGTIVTDVFHTFSPFGVSGVVVIAESHVTVHTWPEHGYAAVDIFSCSQHLDRVAIRRFLKDAFHATEVRQKTVRRGDVFGHGQPIRHSPIQDRP